jgi:hypothetical protein
MHSAVERREADPPLEPLEPWVVLPVQMTGGHPDVAFSGERRLMAATLTDAIQLYLKHGRSSTAAGQILFRETERWIESGDRSWLLSFENICDVLHLDPVGLRRALYAHRTSGTVRALSFDAGRLRVARGRKIRI